MAMLEVSTNTQIGLGLTVMGIAFLFLGVVFFFDKGLLAIGNRQKLKGTIAFFTGIIILLAGHPIIGVLIEIVGFYLLFKSFLPTAFQYATSYLPFFNTFKNRSVI